MKKILVFAFIITFGIIGLFAVGHPAGDVDGEIRTGEYSNLIELRKAELYWDVEGIELKIALRAKTDGWMAVGLGSPKMDGSVMFMGYYKDGESFFEEHLGKGHSHSKVENDREVQFGLTEVDDVTVLEFRVRKSDFVSSGENQLPVILAYGARDSFRAMHRYRDSTVIQF